MFSHLERNWVRKESENAQEKGKRKIKEDLTKNKKQKKKRLDWSKIQGSGIAGAASLLPVADSGWKKGKNGVIFKTALKRRSDLADGRKEPHTTKKTKKNNAACKKAKGPVFQMLFLENCRLLENHCIKFEPKRISAVSDKAARELTINQDRNY